MKQIRDTVRNIILVGTGFILVFIVLRFFLDLFSSNNNGIVKVIRDISNIFIAPFSNIAGSSAASNFNGDAIVAFIFWLVIGFIIAGIITSFLYENIEEVFLNIIDALFKIVELFLFLRIIFDFFRIDSKGEFAKVVYQLTSWADINIIQTSVLDNRINLNLIIVLVIVIIFDLLIESVIEGLLYKDVRRKVLRRKVVVGNGYFYPQAQQQPKQFIVNQQMPQQYAPVQQQPQQITINVPVPQGMVKK
jgi:hypothetical protein